MTAPTVLLSIWAIVFLLTGLASVARKTLHEVSWHDLEDYCRRKKQRQVFDVIHDSREQAVLVVESLEALGLTVFFVVLFLWNQKTEAFGNPASGGWILKILALAFSVLAIAVWIPATVARLWAAPFLCQTWRIWRLSHWLMRPWLLGAGLVDTLLRRAAGRVDQPSEEEALEDEIKTLVTEGLRDGLMEPDTREMIEGVIELGDADVADIMTPRSEIDAIPMDLDWLELMRSVIQCGRTRIPVYDKILDNVVGVLYVKDLLPELAKDPRERRQSLSQILREPWFVPKSRRLDDLLQDFLQTRNHLSIVVDEYMAVEGLVTIEDVLEEIVGEIVDESDDEQLGEIRPIDANVADVHGRAHLDEVNEKLGLDLQSSEDFDTIAGLVVSRLGRIPKSGESIELNNVRITVLEASRRKVEEVRLESLEHSSK